MNEVHLLLLVPKDQLPELEAGRTLRISQRLILREHGDQAAVELTARSFGLIEQVSLRPDTIAPDRLAMMRKAAAKRAEK